ncbi:MAG: DnaJ domain-containing protein [Pseudomonadota bacterium]
MSMLFRALLILLTLAYLISPFDLIPEVFVPYLGWIDDTFLIGLLIYYLKYGRLPGLFYRQSKKQQPFFRETGHSRTSDTFSRDSHTRKNQEQEKPEPGPVRSAREILGVSKNATRQEIQSAFREAVKRYHPDRVSHLGKEFQDLANKKFIEINEAYNTLIKG